MIGISLYASPINLWSLLEESNFLLIGALIFNAPTFINTIRKAVNLININIDIKDPLFVFKRG